MDPREDPSPLNARLGASPMPVQMPVPVPDSVTATAADSGMSGGPTPAEVDAELARLVELPLGDHVEVFAAIHQRLTTSLAMTVQMGSAENSQDRSR